MEPAGDADAVNSPKPIKYQQTVGSDDSDQIKGAASCHLFDELLREHLQSYCESRPPASFVLRNQHDTPVFDGNVATAGGNGTGNLLHVCAVLDRCWLLSILLVLETALGSTHTAFRRHCLHEAACNGSVKVSQFLLELSMQAPRRRNMPMEHILTTIQRLSPTNDTKKSELDCARALVQAIGLSKSQLSFLHDIQHRTDGHGNTALHWASFKNHVAVCRLLLQYHANPDCVAQPSGWTPLHDAAYANAHECLQVLLDAGASVDVPANSGATPLCFAAQEDAAEATELLLRRGADLSIRKTTTSSRFSGYTPLHYCAHYNAQAAAKVLLSHHTARLSMEMRDLNQRLPIHVAVARGSADVLRCLLQAGARVETRSPPGSPRSTACRNPTASVEAPILKSMIPSRPISSSKPWNCLSQSNIDACKQLMQSIEQHWTTQVHDLFTPNDRRCVMELLKIGKHLELDGSVPFNFLWPEILSFCGRGWFEVEDETETEAGEDATSLYNAQLHLPSFC